MSPFSPRGLVFRNGAFQPSDGAGAGAMRDAGGGGVAPPVGDAVWLPGFVNAHSHAFQRVLRGRVEGQGADFWGWRERMYHAALRLGPEEVRTASRAAFLEMALAGFTSVVEFHYLHHDPDGRPYADANELAVAVLEAAADVGIRVCLLATAYARGGWQRELDLAQRRFADPTPEVFLQRAEELRARIDRSAFPGGARGGVPRHTFGLALHSVRALPADWMREIGAWGRTAGVPVHAHASEQPAEVEACLAEHARRPVELLDELGLLDQRFTAVHAVHLTEGEISLLAASGAGVCACPSTEANLADGFVPAAALHAAGVPISLGTDSHAAIDPFAELRELEYRERLRSGRRMGVAPPGELLESVAGSGAAAAGWPPAEAMGDWTALDGSAPALAGAATEDLPGHLLVAGTPAMVREVRVGGDAVIRDGRHPRQDEFLDDFRTLQAGLWR